jgi:DNA-binding NarL/FixJ family response regulator
MIKVFIADDHQVLIEGLKLLLDEHPKIQITHTASNGQQVLDLLEDETCDVILMDINMPVISGLDACKIIKKKYPEIKVIALSTFNKGSFIQQMLKNGASGYLLKNTSREELIEAILKVHDGKIYLNSETNQLLIDNLMNKSNGNSFIPSLTRREKEVLKLIAEELTTNEIAEKLFISLNTVETHRRNLISKFNVRNSVGLVKAAMEKGLLE